jgi:hypothetical protein
MRIRISGLRVRWDMSWALHARHATKWVEMACGRGLGFVGGSATSAGGVRWHGGGCGDEVPHQPADLRNAQRYELVAVGGVLPQA